MSPPGRRILVVGEAILDYHVDHDRTRLGGLFHAARALDALGVSYGLAYAAPEYLSRQAEKTARELGANLVQEIGGVRGAPNVIAVGESTEAGDQRYRDLLRTYRERDVDLDALGRVVDGLAPTDALLMFDEPHLGDAIRTVRDRSGARIHIDTHGPVANAAGLSTIFTSTSGYDFVKLGRDPAALRGRFPPSEVETLVLKENRGGSRVYLRDGTIADGPSFPTETTHSVGVGDVFDATWLAQGDTTSPDRRLRLPSWLASEYAATLDDATFREATVEALKHRELIDELHGVRLPWEVRAAIDIYFAAPDFPHVGVEPLTELYEALEYHNFKPHRPVQELGLGGAGNSEVQDRSIYLGDRQLMDQCALLIAVPLTDDPGTYAELGMFAASGRPTILYNPRRLPMNLFVRNTATRVCTTVGQAIDAVFSLTGR